MQAIKYTYVDALTRIPCSESPMANGPDTPVRVTYVFSNESEWPTHTPVMYGHTDAENAGSVPGVLQILTEDEYQQAFASEMTARRSKMTVTPRQARLALLGVGLLDRVDEAIASIEDDQERAAAAIEWEYATTIERLSPWVGQIGVGLGMTDDQLDELFAIAATL